MRKQAKLNYLKSIQLPIYVVPFVPYLTLMEWTNLCSCGHHCFVTLIKPSKITSLSSSSSSSEYICSFLLLFLSFLALMETSLPLATESFSYSWLSNSKPPLDHVLVDQPLRLSIYSSYQNFNFDVSNLQSPPLVAHADELFSDGLIRPLFVDPFKGESYNCTPEYSPHAMSTSSPFSSTTLPEATAGISPGFLRKWRRSTRQNLRDLFSRFRRKLGWSRKNTRVGDVDKAEWESPPKPIGAYCDHENSIYEAVLHCKRSFEK